MAEVLAKKGTKFADYRGHTIFVVPPMYVYEVWTDILKTIFEKKD